MFVSDKSWIKLKKIKILAGNTEIKQETLHEVTPRVRLMGQMIVSAR